VIVSAIALSPDGGILASGGTNLTITLWNLKTGEPIQTLKIDNTPTLVGGEIHALVFSPDGQQLAVGMSIGYKDLLIGNENSLQLWNVQTGTPIVRWQGHTDTVNSIAFTADGKTLISGSSDGSIKFWEMAIFDR
jgi:WD40 repeat protein